MMKNVAVWRIFADGPTTELPKRVERNRDKTIYFAFKFPYFMSLIWLFQISKHGNDSMLPMLVYRGKFVKTLYFSLGCTGVPIIILLLH